MPITQFSAFLASALLVWLVCGIAPAGIACADGGSDPHHAGNLGNISRSGNPAAENEDTVAAACGPELAMSVPGLSAAWQRLRVVRGHFDGQSWQADIDRWQGRKHCLMQVWRSKLLQAAAPASAANPAMSSTAAPSSSPSVGQLLQAFGQPDAQGQADAPAPAACLSGAPLRQGHNWAWYSWRGQHDGLLLVRSQSGLVQQLRWCLSLE